MPRIEVVINKDHPATPTYNQVGEMRTLDDTDKKALLDAIRAYLTSKKEGKTIRRQAMLLASDVEGSNRWWHFAITSKEPVEPDSVKFTFTRWGLYEGNPPDESSYSEEQLALQTKDVVPEGTAGGDPSLGDRASRRSGNPLAGVLE